MFWENSTGDALVYTTGYPGELTAGVSSTWQGGADNGMPATFPATTPTSGTLWSIYASYSSNTPALTINSLGTLAQDGAALFQDQTNSTVAFQIQNSLGSSLFTADTADMAIVISGTTTTFGTLEVSNAHFESVQTTPPTVNSVINCGSGATATVTTGSTDSSGSFTINAGTGSPTTCDTTVQFNQTYGTTPKSVILTPASTLGGATSATSASASDTANSFTVKLAPNNATAGAIYSYYYWVIE